MVISCWLGSIGDHLSALEKVIGLDCIKNLRLICMQKSN